MLNPVSQTRHPGPPSTAPAAVPADRHIPAIASYPMPADATANRAPWHPRPDRAALLIHDMQEFFLDKFDVAQEPIPTLVRHIRELREHCRRLSMPVYYTAQPIRQPPGDRALLNDMWGAGLTAPDAHRRAGILAELAPQAGDVVLDKWRYSAFKRTDLEQRLRAAGRDQLIICGVYAHIGCLATALEAFMLDIQPFLASDAVADFSPAEHGMAVNYVAQRCGASLTTAQILADL